MRNGVRDGKVLTIDVTNGSKGPMGGHIIGINLGWDFTAEHEWGIDKLDRVFGIPGKPERRSGHGQSDLVGADVRTITEVPDELRFFEDLGGYAYLICSRSLRWIEEGDLTAEQLDRIMGVEDGPDEDGFSTAWSDGDFGVRMKNDALSLGRMMLGQIYEAFKKLDVMIFLGGEQRPFANRGLILAIRSRVPDEFLDGMRAADVSWLDLMDAVERTGIKEKLKAAGLGYFALSPRWASEIQSTKSGEARAEHPVVFWLNPMEQDRFNFGWFTVEQLLEWIDGKGPIPKRATS